MSYSGSPTVGSRDYIRMQVGDVYGPVTNTTETFQIGEVVNDNEIDLLISLFDFDKATLETAKLLKPRIAGKTNEKVGDVEIDYSDWYDSLKDWIKEFEKGLVSLGDSGGAYVGGVYPDEDAAVTTGVNAPLFSMDDE